MGRLGRRNGGGGDGKGSHAAFELVLALERGWSLSTLLVLSHALDPSAPDLLDFDARPSWTIRLPSRLRHIGFELRFSLRHDHAGVDVWFWRDASVPVWEAMTREAGCLECIDRRGLGV
jgi:hypothetical protein